jgi:hypothetical protein
MFMTEDSCRDFLQLKFNITQAGFSALQDKLLGPGCDVRVTKNLKLLRISIPAYICNRTITFKSAALTEVEGERTILPLMNTWMRWFLSMVLIKRRGGLRDRKQ